MSDQQEQRKLKPIYDALDTGSYKIAIQTCNKLLKKQPQHETLRALKSLALLRAGKGEEAVQICDELLASKPTDETVLGILSHVLKNLERGHEITGMFEEAFKKQPQNEELGAQTFMSMIRVGSWKSAQVVALKLYKTFSGRPGTGAAATKFLFWSIMSAVLQAQNAGGVIPHTSGTANPDNAPILLTLALRMMSTSPVPSFITPDHFYLHLTILKSLDQIDQAYDLVQSERGRRLCETSLVVEELRRDIFKAKNACREEAILSGERLKKRDRNWTTFLSLIDATFSIIRLNESQSKSSTDPAAPVADSDGAGPPPSETNGESLAEPDVDNDPERTPKATPLPELPLEPQALIGGIRDLFERLAQEDGKKERGAHLALLHLEKKVRYREEGKGNALPDTLIPLLQQYFADFSDKACCFEDLKPYVASLAADTELPIWIHFLQQQDSQRSLAEKAGVQREINVLKLLRFSQKADQSTEEKEVENAKLYLKLYFEALPVGKGLVETDLQPADDLTILAVNAFVSAWIISKKQTYIHQALVALEYASSKSKQNAYFRVLAVRLYRLIGANGPALDHYHHMDVKQVQTDTMSHLILSRGSTFSLAATGDLTMMSECIAASDIYTQNSSDTADMIVRAFQYEKYSQITEFVEFEDRLDNSLQRDLTRLEYVRMKFTTEKLEPDALLIELAELEFVLEKMHHDNRDFSIIPNYQPRGQQLSEQTTMGVTRGFQWLTVFLQLYIRAYARACRVETTIGADMNVFLTSWLSEMTEEEKTFLRFSQVLHEWVPCPPLQSREAALAAVGAVQANLTVGDAVPSGDGSKTPPPPHVKRDGSDPVTVQASSETAVQYFEDVIARAKTLITDGALLWEILHLATLAQEAFILLQIVSLPWLYKKGKKPSANDTAVGESLRAVRSKAAQHLRDLAALLSELAETEGKEETKTSWVEGCAGLGEIDSALNAEFVGGVAKSVQESRKSVVEGIGKGILKVVTGL